MRYEIEGGSLPVVIIHLDAGESLNTEGGAMSWMSPNLKMETVGGGAGKMFSKMLSGEKMFSNRYTAEGGEGFIACASSMPGSILAFEIAPGKEIVCQKSAFLASGTGVNMEITLNKNVGAGFFGGEGFIMQKLSGNGTAFIEVDGYVKEYELAAGEQIILDTGYLAAMDATCSVEIKSVGGVKNALLGGEGLFNTVVNGPGKVYIQSMPIAQMAAQLAVKK